MDRKSSIDLAKPQIKTISMAELQGRLQSFEKKYGLSSEVFHQRATAGLLAEHDDYITWLGYYEAYIRLGKKQAGFPT